MTVLERILDEKRREIEMLRPQFADWEAPAAAPPRRDFRGALRNGEIALIAEFKRRSPSKGALGMERDPAAVAREYEGAGASAMSVLTDAKFFGGSLEDLAAARSAVALPTLRKDFIIDRCQLARTAGPEGPDAVLLIAAALEEEGIRSLLQLAAACGQAALVEVHDEAELERALESGAEIIGINNRNLRTFEVSLDTTLRLRPRIPPGIIVVAESGIHTRDDVRRLTDAGVNAMLVGEALMTAADPRAKVAELLGRE